MPTPETFDTYLTYTGDGITTDFTAPSFDDDTSEVCVSVNGVLQVENTDYTHNTMINQVQFVSAPTDGHPIVVRRNTPINTKLVDFFDGSINKEEDMDLAIDQLFNRLQELVDWIKDATLNKISTPGAWDAKGCRIINVGDPVDAKDAVNKEYVDALAGLTPPLGFVTTGRRVDTTEGLTGGGDLSADRTLKLDINGLVAEASVDSANDYIALWDASAGLHRKVLPANLPAGALDINGLTPESGIDGANDWIPFYDDSAAANRKVNPNDILTAAGGVPTSRLLTAGEGLSGGGDLSANRTFNLDIDSLVEDAAPDVADFLVFYDVSGAIHRKVQVDDAVTAGGGGGGGSGNLVLVESKVLVSDLSTVTFSGLDMNTDGRYRLELQAATGNTGVVAQVRIQGPTIIGDIVPAAPGSAYSIGGTIDFFRDDFNNRLQVVINTNNSDNGFYSAGESQNGVGNVTEISLVVGVDKWKSDSKINLYKITD
jgi:hypothetical protein